MSEQASTEVYIPKDRADVDRKRSATNQERPRKYKDGKKLRLKNSDGFFEYNVTVVSAEYDRASHKWMYTLDDWEGKPIDRERAETELG